MKEISGIDSAPTVADYIEKSQEQRHTFNLRITEDGTRVRLWVRAYDKMGNELTDNILVGFDRTPPTLRDLAIQRNIKGKYTYNSR